MTEICFAPDFDTGKMLVGMCDSVPDDLLRKECCRAGRKLWSESFGGSPAREVVVAVCLAPALAARLKQKPPEEWPEKAKIGTRWVDLLSWCSSRSSCAGQEGCLKHRA